MQRYSYDSKANKFVLNERYTSQVETFKITRGYIKIKKEELIKLGVSFHMGEITGRDFQIGAAQILKSIHIANATLGKNTTKLTDKDLGILEGILQQQFYSGVSKSGKPFGIRHLAREVLDGKVAPARLSQRLGAYAESGQISLSAMQRERARNSYTQERRIRHSEHSCASCIMYESMGWQSIGSLPLVKTQCECGSSCKCQFEFR